MASETRNLTSPFAANGSWTDESNAYVVDDTYAYTSDLDAIADYGSCPYQTITQVPTSITDFKIRWFDSNADHIDDTHLLQIYNNHTSTWETLETFNSGNVIHTVLETDDFTTELQTKFNAATDKSAFLNNLQIRQYVSATSGGKDDPRFSVAWSNFTYEYTAPPLTIEVYDEITVTAITTLELTPYLCTVFDVIDVQDIVTTEITVLEVAVYDSINVIDIPIVVFATLILNIKPDILLEDFENTTGDGFDDTGWSIVKDAGALVDPDTLVPGISGAPSRWGAQCMRLESSAGEDAYILNQLQSPQADTIFSFDIIINAHDLTTANDERYLARIFDSSDNEVWSLRFRNPDSGVNVYFELDAVDDGTVNTYIGFDAISSDTLYTIEVKWDVTNNIWSWKVNSIAQRNDQDSTSPVESEGTLTSTHPINIEDVRFGAWGGSSQKNLETFFDAIRIEGVTRDHINITDIAIIQIITNVLSINIFDSIDVSTTAAIEITIFEINVYDSIDVGTTVDIVLAQYTINVFDSINVTDVSELEILVLEIDVYDSISVTDASPCEIPILEIAVYDSIEITDVTFISLSGLTITVFESIDVSTVALLEIPILEIATFESIDVVSATSIEISIFEINVYDSIDVTDTSSISLQTQIYSRGDEVTLQTITDNDLETLFSTSDYDDVDTDNTVRVSQTATEEFGVFLFKDKNTSQQQFQIEWNGQSSRAPSDSSVVLQVFNRNTPAWETLATESEAVANDDFSLIGSVLTNLSDYFDAAFWISCRIYQDAN